MTPLQITANFEPAHAAALLVLRSGCSLKTARKTVRECRAALNTPMAQRLANGALKVSCDAAGAKYVSRPVSIAETNEAALKDVHSPGKLPREAGVELPGPIPPELRTDGRVPFAGATSASGKLL